MMVVVHFRPKHFAMPTSLAAHLLPSLVTPEELAGGDVVVIDVLRASTTITHALAAGAECVIPCQEVEEAQQTAAAMPSGTVITGGERGGLPIEGFTYGNSPEEYREATCRGKTVVFTTTNGTLAMMRCRQAARVLIGAFVNLTAVVQRLTGERPIHLLCAGTRGRITREDVLFAGALAKRLLQSGVADDASLNDPARIALECWQATSRGAVQISAADLAAALRLTQGGRNLISIGLEKDIEVVAKIDRFAILPELDLANWRIVVR